MGRAADRGPYGQLYFGGQVSSVLRVFFTMATMSVPEVTAPTGPGSNYRLIII
jgi:hypothetical protein